LPTVRGKGDSTKRAGGLEVALRPALERNGGVWFGWSGKTVPSADVKTHTVCHKSVTYVVADLSEEEYQEYYNGFANRVLWPILHLKSRFREAEVILASISHNVVAAQKLAFDRLHSVHERGSRVSRGRRAPSGCRRG
jgi:glycosyl transferase family 20